MLLRDLLQMYLLEKELLTTLHFQALPSMISLRVSQALGFLSSNKDSLVDGILESTLLLSQ